MHLKAFDPIETRVLARPILTAPDQPKQFVSSKIAARDFIGQSAISLEMQMPAFHTPVIGSVGRFDRHLPAALPWADPSVLVGESRGDQSGGSDNGEAVQGGLSKLVPAPSRQRTATQAT